MDVGGFGNDDKGYDRLCRAFDVVFALSCRRQSGSEIKEALEVVGQAYQRPFQGGFLKAAKREAPKTKREGRQTVDGGADCRVARRFGCRRHNRVHCAPHRT